MKSIGKWILSAAVVAGGFGLGTSAAQAAQFGVYVRSGPAAYVPQCPGPGYEWVAGYYANGYWVPGQWSFVGVRRDFDRDDYRYYPERDRDWHRDRGWDRDRGGDRDRDRDGDRFRGGDHNHGDDRDRR